MPYFVFSDGRDTFAVQILDPAKVQHARALIDGTAQGEAHIGGIVTVAPADYNVGWAYHIAPEDVSFYDMSAEIGDAPIRDVEEFVQSGRPLDEFLPHNSWGSWATYMVRELNEINGTEALDTLSGTRAADIIFGRGGSDALSGGEGNDYLIGGAGSDRLLGGAGHDKLGGGDGDDRLEGAGGYDVLDGGAGVDKMFGGTGNDTYLVDTRADVPVEYAGEGNDLVKASVSLTLGANIERLKLLGAGDLNGAGNGLANTLIGNSGSNSLWGGGGDDVLYGDGGDERIDSGNDRLHGGLGSDRMHGGMGDDVYFVDNSGDRTVERLEGGFDTVYASVSHTLQAQLERLTLTGTNAINGTGNGLNNILNGNSAANVLSGSGGADVLRGADGNDRLNGGTGSDRMAGGAGNDKFLFDTALNANWNVDRIVDFSVVDDRIQLDDDIFTAVGAVGTLSASAFRTGTAAADADDRIIYDSATGRIYYDSDGNGSGAQVLFAQVVAGLALSNADFQIVG